MPTKLKPDSKTKQQVTMQKGQELDFNILCMPAHKLSSLIKQGKLTSSRLCDTMIERIEQVRPLYNAVTQCRFEAARAEAAALDALLAKFNSCSPVERDVQFTNSQLKALESPLFGVPISIKESVQVADMLNTCGLWHRRDCVAQQDAVVVQNVKRAGMIPICTTNIPECTLFWADCQNPVYGRSLNPYDPSRITGASSGGEGSLIASAGSLLGIGSDIGGSLRTPAHYCGIFSHKPTSFLVSSEGNYPALGIHDEHRLRLFTLGPMTRYASDLRHLLKLMLADENNSKRDTYFKYQHEQIGKRREQVIEQLNDTSADTISRHLTGMKILYCDFDKTNKLFALAQQRESQVDEEIVQAQRDVLDHFASKFACKLEQIDLNGYLKKMFIAWQCMLSGGGTAERDECFQPDEVANLFGINNVPLEMIKWFFGMSKHTKESLLTLAFGLPVPRDKDAAFKICTEMEKFVSDLKEMLETKLGPNGVIIMPTLPTVAHKHNLSILKTEEMRYPSLFNVTQMPATHATIGLSEQDKLPFGVSIASRPFNDALTIAVAEEIENTFGGWRPPPDLPLVQDKQQVIVSVDNTIQLEAQKAST